MIIPQVKSIGGYARVDNVRNKTVEELKNSKIWVIVTFILEMNQVMTIS